MFIIQETKLAKKKLQHSIIFTLLLGSSCDCSVGSLSTCSHANDHDFRFCQRCGYRRRIIKKKELGQVDVDLEQINRRLHHLLTLDSVTNYSKQKDSLKNELEVFLNTLPGYVTLETVTLYDLCRFLVFKDRNGKTQVHQKGCHYMP